MYEVNANYQHNIDFQHMDHSPHYYPEKVMFYFLKYKHYVLAIH